MKKLICALLALSLVLAMTACGGKQTAETTAPAANIEGTMEELLNKVIEQRPVEFAGGVFPIDLTDTSEDGMWSIKSFTGLDDASQLTEAAAYEPMMGSLAFSMVMVRTAAGADPKAVAEAMKSGEKVQLVGFGSFEVKKRAARIGRNPMTKESIEIPASVVPVFKAGKALKDSVSK